MTDPSVIEDALAILRHGPASVLTTKQERNKIASLIERLASQATDPEWVALREALERARPYVVDGSIGIVTVSQDEADADLRQINAELARSAREE